MLAAHVGREQKVKALGREWTLSRWTRRVWAEMVAWARPRLPDPMDTARKMMDMMPADKHAAILDAALRMGCEPVHMGSASVREMVFSMEGQAKLVSLLLQHHHPGTDEDTAFDIVLDVGLEELRKRLEKAEGTAPPPEAAAGNPEAPA